MIKLLFISLSMFFLFGCSNTEETKDEQFNRLIKLSEKKIDSERKAKEIEHNNLQEIKKTEEVEDREEQEEESKIKEETPIDPHVGKTKGEIMVYEMEKISSEMNILQNNVVQYKELRDNLKTYQEKLDNLERRNKAGLDK